MSKSSKKVGLIAEDESDVETLKELLRRITGKNIGFKSFIGRGCGKIRRKADDWAKQLQSRGCQILIVVHDLDRNNSSDLYQLIETNLKPYAIKDTFISIPIEEMESWFLSDAKGVKNALKLKKAIKTYHHPEKVSSPKEVLGREIEKASNDAKIYLNTKHNALIAKYVDLELIKTKCASFRKLHQFATERI